MKLRLRFIFSLLLIVGFHFAHSQKKDSVAVKAVSGVELSFDYGKLFTLATDFESKWEGSIGYRYKSRLMLQIDIGMATLEPSNAYENGTYKAEGIYGSAGLNYIVPIDATNLLYFGAGYGMSMYDDTYSYTIGSNIWADFNQTESRTDLAADWFAITIGSEKRLKLKGLYLGGKLSFRKLNSYDEFEPIDTYAIPGYGRSADSIVPAFNLYIKYLF